MVKLPKVILENPPTSYRNYRNIWNFFVTVFEQENLESQPRALKTRIIAKN